MKSKNIAIFGGSFNPPHIGHQMILTYLAFSYNFDEIWVSPVYHHYFQKDKYLISEKNRLEMSEIAFKKISNKIEIKSIDIDNKFVKTFNTLTYLKSNFKDYNFTLILGEDNYLSRDRWFKFPEIEKMAEIIYLGREGVVSDLNLPFKFPKISSTKIRDGIKNNNIDIFKMLDIDVIEYIKDNKLYK